MADRPLERSTPNSEPASPERKVQASLQVSSMKSDGSLFSRVYIACQLPGGNLDDFFSVNRTNHVTVNISAWQFVTLADTQKQWRQLMLAGIVRYFYNVNISRSPHLCSLNNSTLWYCSFKRKSNALVE